MADYKQLSECFEQAKLQGEFSEVCIEMIKKFVKNFYISYFKLNHSDIDDLTQSVITCICKKFRNFKAGGNGEGYIRRIARNSAVQLYKKKQRIEEIATEMRNKLLCQPLKENESIPELIELKELLEALEECIAKLEDHYKDIINLQLKELSSQEIFELRGIPKSTQIYRYQKSNQALKKCLANKGIKEI